MATVVIVGRPNVGKSTLFNRLVGGRVAITLREPGITRDRLSHPAEWQGRKFTVIDTGGFVPDPDAEIEAEIVRQVNIALNEADVIILVVDGTAGLLPADEEIARRLRRQGKPFLVAVNKCDKSKFDITDFHRLGNEKLFPIAAEHGTGVAELLDEVISQLPPESTSTAPGEEVALAILGRPNVGKSTLLNRLLGKERAIVTPLPGTTRDTVEDTFQWQDTRFRIIDTAGIRRRTRITAPVEFYSVRRALAAIDRADIALVMIDATEGPTAQDKRIINLVTERGKGLVIIANKTDLIPRQLEKKVKEYITSRLQFVSYAPLVYTSLLKGKGVTDVVRQAKAVYHSGAMRLSKKFLNLTLLEQLKTNPPGIKVRVLGISQTGIRPPVFRLRLSDPDAIDTRYQRYVLNLIRQQFQFTGYPIKLDVTA